MQKLYACTKFENQNGIIICTDWQEIQDYSGYKLTNAEMAQFILTIALLFATVAGFKIVRRAFF